MEEIVFYEDAQFSSKADAFATAAKACADYGIFKLPEFRWREKAREAYLNDDNTRIVIPEPVWDNPPTLLHEIAHYIVENHPKLKSKVRKGMMKYIFLFSLFLCFSIEARLFLDISVINKKGIDIGLTLGSELHSVEEVHDKNLISLKMQSGIQVEIKAQFLEEKENKVLGYGPNPKIIIFGKILDAKGKVLKNFDDVPLKVDLEKMINIGHSQDTQLVEVRVKPYLK